MPLKENAPKVRIKSIIIEKIEILPQRDGYVLDQGFHESVFRRCRIYLRINDELVVDAVFDEQDHGAAYWDATNDSLPNHISSILSDDEITALWSMHRDCIKLPKNCESYRGTDLVAHARENFHNPAARIRERWLSWIIPVRTSRREPDKVCVKLRTYDDDTEFFITREDVRRYSKGEMAWNDPLAGYQRHWVCEADMEKIYELAENLMDSKEPYKHEYLNIHLLGGQRD